MLFRSNVATTATYTDWALKEVAAAEQTQWRHHLLDPKLLVRGRNLLAVELHQVAQDGTDMNFDAQLSATVGPTAPPTFIRSTPQGLELSWPAAFEGWTLQAATTLSPADWAPVALTKTSIDGWIYATYIPAPGDAARYFRLVGP